MTNSADIPARSLTIHLARAGVTEPQLLTDAAQRLSPRELHLPDANSAKLYIQSPRSNPPRWAGFFEGYREEFGENASTSAALLVRIQDELFALTFGRGLFLINEDKCEERFGLKVALNCIGEGTVRTLDKHSLDQLLRHSREQASRDATAAEFGFDVEQDLLRGVTGKPSDPYYGIRIAGANSLHVAVPVTLAHLPGFLEQVSEQFVATTYQRNFGWIDQIAEVTSRQEHDLLDNELVERIVIGDTTTIWMAVPELISWENVAGFKFLSRRQTAERTDIHLDYFLDSIAGETITTDLLANKRVRVIDANGDSLNEWSAYKCLYAEIEHGNDSFVLSGGRWYKVRSSFVADINSAYSRIRDYETQLPECNEIREEDYLKRVAGSGDFALMDQKKLFYSGGQSQIEFCDLFNRGGDIVHVKRYGQSTVLSHLFAQGVVSGELFQMDSRFRELLNEKLPRSHRIANPRERPKQNQYQVVFGIIADRLGSLHLPFFSRVNLKHSVRRLEGYGFRVAKAKISVSEEQRRLARFRRRGTRS